MRTEPARGIHRRTTFGALVTCLVLFPALLTPPIALLAALPAAFAVAVAMVRLPLGRVTVAGAAAAAVGVSAVADGAFLWGGSGWAQARWVLPWIPFELLALLILTVRVVRRAPAAQAAVVGAALVAAVLVLPLRFTLRNAHSVLEQSVLGVLVFAVLALAAAGTGRHLRAQDERRAGEVRRAKHEQRLEVARDLHDFVAHEVTGILLETQAAQVAGYDRAGTEELLERLESAGQRALASMDDTLRVLREPDPAPEPPPTRVHGLAALVPLLDRFEGSGPSRTRLDLEPGLAGTLPREVEDAAYRLVLEALTNVRRHAPQAGSVNIQVACTEGAVLRIAVTDDGPVCRTGEPRQGGGTGLAALAERFAGLGGSLDAGPAVPSGWRVAGSLPVGARRA